MLSGFGRRMSSFIFGGEESNLSVGHCFARFRDCISTCDKCPLYVVKSPTDLMQVVDFISLMQVCRQITSILL